MPVRQAAAGHTAEGRGVELAGGCPSRIHIRLGAGLDFPAKRVEPPELGGRSETEGDFYGALHLGLLQSHPTVHGRMVARQGVPVKD